MGAKKVKNTKHAYRRCEERFGLPKRTSRQMIESAFKKGIAVENLPDGPVKDYLRTKGKRKKIKVYKNKVFVFCRNSTRCITVYPLEVEEEKEETE